MLCKVIMLPSMASQCLVKGHFLRLGTCFGRGEIAKRSVGHDSEVEVSVFLDGKEAHPQLFAELIVAAEVFLGETIEVDRMG